MTKITDAELRDLLSLAAARERQAVKRATIYTAIPVLIGLILIGLSAYKLHELEVQKGVNEQVIAEQKDKLKSLEEETARVKQEADYAQEKADIAQQQVAHAEVRLSQIRKELNDTGKSLAHRIAAASRIANETEESLKSVNKLVNTGGIIISGEMTLGRALSIKRRVNNLGYEKVAIYLRQDAYRVIVEFPTIWGTTEGMIEIRSRLNVDNSINNLNQWCVHPQKRNGYFQCAE